MKLGTLVRGGVLALVSLGMIGLMDASSSQHTSIIGKGTETLTSAESYATPASSDSPSGVVGPGGVNPYGFDRCSHTKLSTMQQLKPNFGWIGIYIGGGDAGCPDAFPTESWIDTVISAGWYVEPIWVGPQSTCSRYGPEKISVDSYNNYQTAYSQGQNSAHHAYTALLNDGFSVADGGVPIVDDIESLTSNSLACDAAEEAFVRGWDATLPRQLPAVYGSSGGSYLANLTGSPAPAFIWGANYNTNNPDPSDLPPIPSQDWDNNQRIKQYDKSSSMNNACLQGNVSFSFDCDYEDAPLY